MPMHRLVHCLSIPTVLVATTALAACGGRELEADAGSGSDSTSTSGDDTNDASVSLSATTSMTTSMTTAMTTTADPTTDPATTDTPVDTSGDPETSGNPETTAGGEGCCDVHRTPGCDEDAVSACVCDAAPECCVFGWAENCVELAMTTCEATCRSGEDSTGPSEDSSTGAPGGDCEELVQIELTAEDAVLDGWELVQSMFVEEGTVAGIIFDNGFPQGTVTWDLDIPCNDTFHVWVRGRNAGSNDSYFARLDGGPDPAPIFELDCEGGDDYRWRELNWRDPENGLPCEYVEDPWLADWEAGAHQVQLEYRESPGVSRLIVTNDDAFVPE